MERGWGGEMGGQVPAGIEKENNVLSCSKFLCSYNMIAYLLVIIQYSSCNVCPTMFLIPTYQKEKKKKLVLNSYLVCYNSLYSSHIVNSSSFIF